MTRERIRQIEIKAMRKLRALHESRSPMLQDYTEGTLASRALAAKAAGGLRKSS